MSGEMADGMGDVDVDVDAVVVGAGLAGLRAATELVGSGASVVVLEARDRVGGRAFSHRFADGQWCERGAEFAPGELAASWASLQQSVGRVYLAGEHTDGFAGFMEGALRSGRRAAAVIRNA